MTGEESLWIPCERGRLCAMLHPPAAGAPRAAVLVCPPLFEEHKCAYRCLVDTARSLAGRGYAALRFDYWGAGDSEGEHAETDVPAHLESIRAAGDLLSDRFPSVGIALLGLRLGGTLAAEAAATGLVRPDWLLLWEPVLSGKALMARERKRQLVRRMMMKTEAAKAGAQPAAEAPTAPPPDLLDLEGYAVSEAFLSGIERLDLAQSLPGAAPAAVFLLQISFREKLLPELEKLVAEVGAAGVSIEAGSVVMPPVWNRLDPFDWSAPARATIEWLDAHCSA